MGFCTTCGGSWFRSVTVAMAKAAGARVRSLGGLPTAPDWSRRAALCEQCPMRVVVKTVSYCGKPFLSQIDRDPATDGCGCPTRDKAKSPAEHCPLDARSQPAAENNGHCTCRWCQLN